MKTRTLPELRELEYIKAGSLVMVPEDNLWGIRIKEVGLHMLRSRRNQGWPGLLADFGMNFDLWVHPENTLRISYPWRDVDSVIGGLVLFNDDNKTTRSIVIGTGSDAVLITFDLDSGTQAKRVSEAGVGVVYPTWGIELLNSSDGGEPVSVYTHSPK